MSNEEDAQQESVVSIAPTSEASLSERTDEEPLEQEQQTVAPAEPLAPTETTETQSVDIDHTLPHPEIPAATNISNVKSSIVLIKSTLQAIVDEKDIKKFRTYRK